MITQPDFLAKNLLVIFSEQIKDTRFANENIVIEENGKIVQQVSLHTIFTIFIIGECTITSKLILQLQKHGIILVLMRNNFEVIDVIGGTMNGNILLRQTQYMANTDDIDIAKKIVENKIYVEQFLIKKLRDRTEEQNDTILKLGDLRSSIAKADVNSSLLGFEGNAAKLFFTAYFSDMDWIRRSPRTKFDINNLLLDIGYTFLFHFIEALLLLYGFDIYKGVYHKEFYARKSLVCDIQEPFRCIIDEALRKAFNLGQISEKDFGFTNGAYFLKPQAIRKYTSIFFRAILSEKKSLFLYVQMYYRYLLDPTREFPKFIPE